MTAIQIIENPVLKGKRRALVLSEDRIGHYPEFRSFFVQQFSIVASGLSGPGYVPAPSGMVYAVLFIGRSGEIFLAGVGGQWRVEDLEATGRLYQLSVATSL